MLLGTMPTMSDTVGTPPEAHPVDDRHRRAEQRARLARLRERLEGEGASGDLYLSELLSRAHAGPE